MVRLEEKSTAPSSPTFPIPTDFSPQWTPANHTFALPASARRRPGYLSDPAALPRRRIHPRRLPLPLSGAPASPGSGRAASRRPQPLLPPPLQAHEVHLPPGNLPRCVRLSSLPPPPDPHATVAPALTRRHRPELFPPWLPLIPPTAAAPGSAPSISAADAMGLTTAAIGAPAPQHSPARAAPPAHTDHLEVHAPTTGVPRAPAAWYVCRPCIRCRPLRPRHRSPDHGTSLAGKYNWCKYYYLVFS
nr:proline-rich receptor-like protein kinase PERK2 [Lolium perenne]